MNRVFKGGAIIGAAMSLGACATASKAEAGASHLVTGLAYDVSAPVPDDMAHVCSPDDLAYLRAQANQFVNTYEIDFPEKDDAATDYMQAYEDLHAGQSALDAYVAYSERARENFKEFDSVARQVESGQVSLHEVDVQIYGRLGELSHLEQFYIQAHTAESIAREFDHEFGEGAFARTAGFERVSTELSCDIER